MKLGADHDRKINHLRMPIRTARQHEAIIAAKKLRAEGNYTVTKVCKAIGLKGWAFWVDKLMSELTEAER